MEMFLELQFSENSQRTADSRFLLESFFYNLAYYCNRIEIYSFF